MTFILFCSEAAIHIKDVLVVQTLEYSNLDTYKDHLHEYKKQSEQIIPL